MSHRLNTEHRQYLIVEASEVRNVVFAVTIHEHDYALMAKTLNISNKTTVLFARRARNNESRCAARGADVEDVHDAHVSAQMTPCVR